MLYLEHVYISYIYIYIGILPYIHVGYCWITLIFRKKQTNTFRQAPPDPHPLVRGFAKHKPWLGAKKLKETMPKCQSKGLSIGLLHDKFNKTSILKVLQNPQTLRVETRCWVSGWWFGTWLLWLSHHIGNFIIPTDELIFFRGVGIPPTSLRFRGFVLSLDSSIVMIWFNRHKPCKSWSYKLSKTYLILVLLNFNILWMVAKSCTSWWLLEFLWTL